MGFLTGRRTPDPENGPCVEGQFGRCCGEAPGDTEEAFIFLLGSFLRRFGLYAFPV